MPVSRPECDSAPTATNNVSASDQKSAGYKPAYASMAEKMCQFGAATADLAQAFGVTIGTINQWQTTHNEFSEACRVGREKAADQVEASLYQRACGYESAETKIVNHRGEFAIIKTIKHIPPDVNAQKFWLINRRPDKWCLGGKDPDIDHENPLQTLARQLQGTAMRPVENPPE